MKAARAMAAVIGVARKRELRRCHRVGREQLQQPLGGPDEAAGIVAQIENQPAVGQLTNSAIAALRNA